MQKRIEYIDSIKGFAIFLMVMGHVIAWNYSDWQEICLYSPEQSNKYKVGGIIWQLIYSFHMPLFFMISGFLSYKHYCWSDFGVFFKKKTVRLLIPWICTFGIIFLVRGSMGYWFLLCLFEISVLGFIIIWGMEKLNKSAFWGIDLALICLIYILLRIFHVGAISISFLSLGYVVNAFMPFFVGVLLKKYRNLFKICIEESWFYTMLLLVFVMLFVSRYFMHFECFFMLFKISYHVLPLIGSLLVFHAFANGIFMNEYIRRVLCYIGVKSFPIYILHILFVIQIPQIGDFILEQNIITSIVFQLLYSLFLSVIAIILSLVSYKILAFSPLCRRSLFGE